MRLQVQIPYSYSHVMALVVKFHLFMVVVVAGSTCGKGFIAGSVANALWGYTLLVINSLVFEGLLEMHSHMVRGAGARTLGEGPSRFFYASSHA